MTDLNKPHKAKVLERARATHNKRVLQYVQHDLLPKIDQAGPHAGVWLENLENNFEVLAEEPEGLLEHFQEKDFDDLFKALYGYDRADVA